MKLSELLYPCFSKEEVQDICYALDIQMTGNKDQLVNRILRFLRKRDSETEIRKAKSIILNEVRQLNKYFLLRACEDAGLDTSGTKDQLLKRVIRNLEWPIAVEKEMPETQEHIKIPEQSTLDENDIYEPPPPEGFKEERSHDLKNFLIRYFEKDVLKSIANNTGFKVSGSKEKIAEELVEKFKELPDDEIETFLNMLYWSLDDWKKACKAFGVSDSGLKRNAVAKLLPEIPEVSSRLKPECRYFIGLKIGAPKKKKVEKRGVVFWTKWALSSQEGLPKKPGPARESKVTEIKHPKVIPDSPINLPPPPDEEIPPAHILDESRYDLYKKIHAEIVEWKPRRPYRYEDGYRENLANYLENKGHNIKTEVGEYKVDILVDDQIPIEVKKCPNSTEYRTLFAQLFDYEGKYGCAIGVICDVKDIESFDAFKTRILRVSGGGHVLPLCVQ